MCHVTCGKQQKMKNPWTYRRGNNEQLFLEPKWALPWGAIHTQEGFPSTDIAGDECQLSKVARYSFSGSIRPKFEHKLRPHKQSWFGKIATTIVLDKDEICQDQGCNNIGVVIATKWHHYLFYLQQYFSALGSVLPKSFTGASSCNSRLNVHEV